VPRQAGLIPETAEIKNGRTSVLPFFYLDCAHSNPSGSDFISAASPSFADYQFARLT
jgi:hypothetical protein